MLALKNFIHSAGNSPGRIYHSLVKIAHGQFSVNKLRLPYLPSFLISLGVHSKTLNLKSVKR